MTPNKATLKIKQWLTVPYAKQIIMITLLLIITLISYMYWRHAQQYVSTNDSYLNANIIQIAPRVTGQVTHLYVTNNQFVHKGDILIELDPTQFQIAAAKARSQLKIEQARWKNTQLTSKRTLELVNKKILSTQSGDDISEKLQIADGSIELAKSNLDQAELDLKYTRISAQADGWITNMTLQIGNVVQANQPLFALVTNAEYWADANFKETELIHVKPGQTATIVSDLHPDHPFKGIVDSISRGSGTVFSLLPPQNATGNWVKVTQRVPVRVRILNADTSYPLRIGTSATVTINTHSLKELS